MRRKTCYMASAIFLAVLSTAIARADDDPVADSKEAIANFKKADSSLETFFTNSAGYAVFPSVGKGGFIVGGARGKGLVYETNKLIGTAVMTQASFGAQVGGQEFAEVVFFETPGALDDFKDGKFELSADISAVAASEGASKAIKYKKGVAVFTLPKRGLMVQAAVGGQRFKFDRLLAPTGPDKKDEEKK